MGWVKGMKLSRKSLKTLKQCLEYIRNGAGRSKPVGVDGYILDNVYAFCQRKTKILLKSDSVSKVDASAQELVFYSLRKTKDIPNDNCNVFRADLFSLFPNLVEVDWWTNWGDYQYRFNPKSLISVLSDATFPESLCRIRMRDYGQKWIKAAFAAVPDVEQQVGALDFVMEQYTVKENEY